MLALDNPCVKTGCTMEMHGRVWHGDLFDLGDYYVLNCSIGCWRQGEPELVHLQTDSYHSSHQADRVVFIHKSDVLWFDYAGRTID